MIWGSSGCPFITQLVILDPVSSPVVSLLARDGLIPHGFTVKSAGFHRGPGLLVSSDEKWRSQRINFGRWCCLWEGTHARTLARSLRKERSSEVSKRWRCPFRLSSTWANIDSQLLAISCHRLSIGLKLAERYLQGETIEAAAWQTTDRWMKNSPQRGRKPPVPQ